MRQFYPGTTIVRKLIIFSALLIPVPAIAQQTAVNARTLARLMEADANHDGKITRAELIARRSADFTRFDRNGNGVLSLDDVPIFLRGSAIGQQLGGLIKQFDANGDGRLTRTEFADGPTPVFDLADANHDGVVTKAELEAATAGLQSKTVS